MLNYKIIKDYISFEDLIKRLNYKTYGPFVSTLGKALKRVKRSIKKRYKWA